MVVRILKPSKNKKLKLPMQKPGQSPGTLLIDPEAANTIIDVLQYNGTECVHLEHVSIDDVKPASDHYITWINITGLADISVIEKIGAMFSLERLLLEDIVNAGDLPKIEILDNCDFVVVRKPVFDRSFDTRQVSIVIGLKFVLTFHERSSAYLNPVRERILKAQGKIRKSGADYLSYAIIDCVVDHYFPALTKISELFVDLEDMIFAGANNDFIARIRDLRSNLVKFQSITQSTRDVLNRLIANPSHRHANSTRPFFRDCLDHIHQINDQLDSLKLTSSDLMNHYHSNMTQKLNETMKVLTIIATIFIPLTFITSIYGMNFNTEVSRWNMPELHSPFGYPVVIGFMVIVAAIMLVWFRRKGWLGGPNS